MQGVHDFAQLDQGRGDDAAWRDALRAFEQARQEADDVPPDWSVPATQRSSTRKSRFHLESRAQALLDSAYAKMGRVGRRNSRAPPSGEVRLAWLGGAEGWIGFAEDDGGVQIHRWPKGTTPTPGVLVAPFESMLNRADRVVMMPYGELEAVPLHAAVVGHEPLVLQRDVSYSLDLGTRHSGRLSAGRALVVADPTRNLAAAREEGTWVRDWLEEHDWSPRLLEGSQATRDAVSASLSEVDLLHYSGHASAGDRWSSRLALARGSLTVADVLAAPSVPRWVILNACDTAGTGDVGAFGLAQAFVAKGAQGVVASSQPIDDEDARLFAKGLYEALSRGATFTEAYRGAVLALQSRRRGGGWTSFRLVHG